MKISIFVNGSYHFTQYCIRKEKRKYFQTQTRKKTFESTFIPDKFPWLNTI